MLMPAFGPVLDSTSVMWANEDGDAVPTPSALLELARYLGTLQTE
jgi:hypothetical protein